jgi:hypothetical protein
MKLEIDTEKDSRATLRGALRMLQAILGEEGGSYSNRPVGQPRQKNIFEDDSSSLSMYGDTVEETPSATSSSESSGSGGLFSMFGDTGSSASAEGSAESSEIKEEEPDDEPQIQIY